MHTVTELSTSQGQVHLHLPETSLSLQPMPTHTHSVEFTKKFWVHENQIVLHLHTFLVLCSDRIIIFIEPWRWYSLPPVELCGVLRVSTGFGNVSPHGQATQDQETSHYPPEQRATASAVHAEDEQTSPWPTDRHRQYRQTSVKSQNLSGYTSDFVAKFMVDNLGGGPMRNKIFRAWSLQYWN